MEILIKKNFPDRKDLLESPPILIHKLDGRSKYNFLVTMTYSDWLNILKKIHDI
jgi:hypothetical protein